MKTVDIEREVIRMGDVGVVIDMVDANKYMENCSQNQNTFSSTL